MRTLTNRKKALLALVLITMVIYGPFVLMMNKPFITNAKNINNNDPIIENILNDIPRTSGVGSWWNASFRFRVEIEFQEPGYFNRSNEPVDVYITFEQGKCHKDTIRVLLYQLGDTWVETPYQIWNKTMYDATYVKSCTITFLTTIEKNDSELYYVYYSDSNDNGNIINPLNKYLQASSLSSDFDGKKLTVLNSEFALEMEEGSSINNFTKQNQNFHTEYSLSPWIKEGIVNSSIYSPDPVEGGAIHNWLVVGPFNFFNPDWNNPITDTAYHIDLSENYIQGDYATGGDAPSIFLDESKQWGYKDFSTYTTYTSYNGYMNLNQYFGNPDTVCAYASVYIMSPVDLNSVYLKVGSDDGIRIWRDGVKIHDNHVLRGPQPDREIADTSPLSFEAGVWYNYIVLVEENTGDWGFNFRFSNNSNLYGNTPQNDPDSITNLNIAIQPPLPVIQTISEVQVGPVFSQYEMTWEDSSDMKIFDTITFYSAYNSWKLERTLWWADDRVNLSFSILNTLYDNTNNVFDDYLYDYTWTESGMNNPSFSPHNYSIIWDSGGSKNLMALGTFLTKFEKGNQFIELSELSWAISYDSTQKIVNFQPGKETNLDNKGAHIWPGDSDYHIKFTFWEYLDDEFGSIADYSAANDKASGIYDALLHPLVQVKDLEESSFFDLTINVTDHDGFNVENVKVYVYNSTDDEITNGYTNEEGIISLLRLPKGNYTLNFTYSDIMSEFPVKSNVAVELNESKSISVGGLTLTSLNLKFQQLDTPRNPLSGVDVEFWYKNSTGDLEFLINTLETDDEGMVSFYWKNTSQTVANISVRAFLLGEYRDINNSVSGLGNKFLNYTFQNRAIDTISIQISSYATDMEFIEPVA
ncbi:MAG: carboxypeptidase-like regulatory domain-containing protein, partial [Candidatus Lokiarchaeota archaeon]|nr:carboxypeptidase-like regulatory domain-containing protein [Candidatus Lokiarchaeota archaeon]